MNESKSSMVLIVTGVLAYAATGIGVIVAVESGNDWLGFWLATVVFVGSVIVGLREIRRRKHPWSVDRST